MPRRVRMSSKAWRYSYETLAASPAKHLERELRTLRGELRATIRAYSARLEVELAESTAAVAAAPPPDSLSRDTIHQFRDLVALLRKRKLKPSKGRCKDAVNWIR